MSNNHPTKKNGIRQATLAFIAILLCVVCLTGVTLALFMSKDSGTIGINVTSGKVSVDIVDNHDKSLVGDVLDFVNPTPEKKMYWEPGATFYTQPFRVKNTGEVTVNYHVYVNTSNASSELVHALDFYLTTDPTKLEEPIDLPTFKGTLISGQCGETYYLVVHMKKEASNKYKNMTLTGIGITVYAVQGNVDVDTIPHGV